MTIEIKSLQCITTLLANYADKIISINEGSSSNKRIESLIELAKKMGLKLFHQRVISVQFANNLLFKTLKTKT